jgi:hypothetical protein
MSWVTCYNVRRSAIELNHGQRGLRNCSSLPYHGRLKRFTGCHRISVELGMPEFADGVDADSDENFFRKRKRGVVEDIHAKANYPSRYQYTEFKGLLFRGRGGGI